MFGFIFQNTEIYIFGLAFNLIKGDFLFQFVGCDQIDFVLSFSVPPGSYLRIFFTFYHLRQKVSFQHFASVCGVVLIHEHL